MTLRDQFANNNTPALQRWTGHNHTNGAQPRLKQKSKRNEKRVFPLLSITQMSKSLPLPLNPMKILLVSLRWDNLFISHGGVMKVLIINPSADHAGYVHGNAECSERAGPVSTTEFGQYPRPTCHQPYEFADQPGEH